MSYTALAEELFRLRTIEYERGTAAKINYASTGEDGVLYRLSVDDGEGMLAGDLARKMGLTSGRIANILKQLERKSYVIRSSGKHDRRQVYVTLTESGREYIRAVFAENIRDLEAQLARLGEEDAKEYIRILGKLLSEE